MRYGAAEGIKVFTYQHFAMINGSIKPKQHKNMTNVLAPSCAVYTEDAIQCTTHKHKAKISSLFFKYSLLHVVPIMSICTPGYE